jgi:hypothetical protein
MQVELPKFPFLYKHCLTDITYIVREIIICFFSALKLQLRYFYV